MSAEAFHALQNMLWAYVSFYFGEPIESCYLYVSVEQTVTGRAEVWHAIHDGVIDPNSRETAAAMRNCWRWRASVEGARILRTWILLGYRGDGKDSPPRPVRETSDSPWQTYAEPVESGR